VSIKYKIVVDGKPQSKQRPEFSRRGGKFRTYTPAKTMKYEKKVKEAVRKVMKKPLEGPVSLTLHFYLHRPQRLIWNDKPMPPCYTDKRPDIDNLIKGVVDGMNGVAFKDDNQIAKLVAHKQYHSAETNMRVEINIECIRDE